MKHFFYFVCIILFAHTSIAQNSVNIIVRDSATQEALIGATVTENDTKNGSTTDLDGRASFETANAGKRVFTITYLGYITKNITLQVPQTELTPIVLLQANEADLDIVTVSAVRTNSRIEDIPTRIEVLGLDDLNEENGVKPGNIMSLLGDIAGIQMQQVSASSGNTFARIQGLNGRYTQILKDGIPQFGGLSGNFGIMQIPPLDLKQIEIIKGSVSTLYGGDAIGGIINLVSKEPQKDAELSFTLNQSSLLETNINGYYGKRFKKVGFTFFAAQTWQKPVDIDGDGLSDSPEVNSTVIHPKFIWYLSPKSTVTLNYTATFDQRTGGNMQYFNKNNNDSIYHISNNIHRHNFDAKFVHDFTNNHRLTVKIANSNTRQNVDTKAYIYNPQQNTIYTEANYFTNSKNMNWVFGLNYNTDYLKTNGFNARDIYNEYVKIPEYNNTTIGLFAQNTWTPTPKFTIESGLRTDFHNVYGNFVLPRLSLLYKANKQITARINGGYGYKTPNLVTYLNLETDLKNLAPITTLKPELSQGCNADINYENTFFKKLRLTFNQSFFFTNLNQPVIDQTNNLGQITLQNADKSLQTQGLQTYARLRYQHTELYLGYVFTDVKKQYDTAQPTPFVTPKHNISTTFFYEPSEQWRFGVESSFIAGQLDQNYQPTPDYFLFAGMVQYNVNRFSFVLNAENLLDVRQNKFGKIYTGDINNPIFQKLWSPIDGRVLNLSVKWKL
jgi:outer membrane receptor for ferrienterochelin and colicins